MTSDAGSFNGRLDGGVVVERTSAQEWRAGWPIVLAAGLGYGVGQFSTTTLGTMVKPLAAAFGWSRGEIVIVLGFVGLSTAFVGPLAGLLGDRVGVRRIALVGVCLYALALGSIGLLTTRPLWSWYLTWGFLAAIFPAVSPSMWATGVASAFRKRRGLALGAALCGSGLATMTAPLVAAWAIQHLSWRWSYYILAAVGLALMLPLTAFCFKDVRKADGSAASPSDATSIRLARGSSLRAAAGTLRFWKLGFSMIVLGMMIAALTVHLQPILTDAGMSIGDAAKVAAAGGPALIIGRIGVGFLLDRFRGPMFGAAVVGLPIVAMLLLRDYHGSFGVGVVIAVFIALAYGAEMDIIAYMTSRYFGMKAFSAIFSSLLGFLAIGGGFGPAIAGWGFDRSGSYHGVLTLMTVGAAVAVLLIATLGKYPRQSWEDQEDTLVPRISAPSAEPP